MSFQPEINQQLAIGGTLHSVAEHPAAHGMPYGQEGRAAVVYQLNAPSGNLALKVFKPRYRLPGLVSLARRQAPLADHPGLRVCSRTVLTPQQEPDLLGQHPDLTYAVLMPWIDGPTWMEVLLEGYKLSQWDSSSLAHSLAVALATMEQESLAHCDLSGPNLLLPALAVDPQTGAPATSPESKIELVDVEQMYGPDLKRPELVPGGSSGYAHKSALEGFWSPEADRFAGAVLLAEILGWSDERVRGAAWGESYFDPEEMQHQTERYTLLHQVLTERWGDNVARLFERAWTSDTLAYCPTFGDWLVRLPKPQSQDAPSSSPALAAQAATSETNLRVLMQKAEQLEAQGDMPGALEAYRRSQSYAPEGSAMWQELALIAQQIERQMRARERIAATQAGVMPALATTSPAPAPAAASDIASAAAPAIPQTVAPNLQPVPSSLAENVGIAPAPQTAAAVHTPIPQVTAVPTVPAKRQKAGLLVPIVLLIVLLGAGGVALTLLQSGSKASPASPPTASATLVAGGATTAVSPTGQGITRSATSASAPVTGADANGQVIGVLRFSDAAGVLDQLTFSGQKMLSPGDGKQYEVWMRGSGGERRQSMGVLKLDAGGKGELSYKDKNGTNLLSEVSGLEVTIEPNPDSNPQPSGDVAFSGSLPPNSTMHVGHLLVASEEAPEHTAWAVGLLRQTLAVNALAQNMAASRRDGDLATMKLDAESIVNIIEGQNGKDYGDLDKDGKVSNSNEDGYGLLLNGSNMGYIQGTIDHAELAMKSPDATDSMKAHGEHVLISAKNAGDFAVQLRDICLRIAVATSVSNAQSDVDAVSKLADYMLNGRDINGNETIDIAPGESSVRAAYQHGQYMADIVMHSGK